MNISYDIDIKKAKEHCIGVQLQIDNIIMLDDLEKVLRTHLTCHK